MNDELHASPRDIIHCIGCGDAKFGILEFSLPLTPKTKELKRVFPFPRK